MRDADSDLACLARSLAEDEKSVIRLLDLQQLKIEQSGIDSKHARSMTEPVYGVFGCLRRWQLLVHCMAHHWPDHDCYMVYEYLNDLTIRDHIEEYLDAMPHHLKAKILSFLAGIDEDFTELTDYDGGVELAQYWRPLAQAQEARWWWLRAPTVLPRGW
jgi:hypothetical protein